MYHHQSEYYVMRGSGIGSIFSNIFRGLIPLAKKLFTVGKTVAQSPAGRKILKAAKRTAMETGLDIAHDTLEGQNLNSVANKNLKRVGKTFLSNVKKEMKPKKKNKGARGIKRGGACGRKKPRAKHPIKKKKKKSISQGRVVKRKTVGKKGKKNNKKPASLLASWL